MWDLQVENNKSWKKKTLPLNGCPNISYVMILEIYYCEFIKNVWKTDNVRTQWINSELVNFTDCKG